MFYILASFTFAAAFVAAMTTITVMLQQYWHKMISALMFGSQGVSIAPRRKPMRPPVRVVRKAIAAPVAFRRAAA
jgi:hypothetical protein